MKRRVRHRHPEEWRFSFKQRQRLFVRMLTNADGVIQRSTAKKQEGESKLDFLVWKRVSNRIRNHFADSLSIRMPATVNSLSDLIIRLESGNQLRDTVRQGGTLAWV